MAIYRAMGGKNFTDLPLEVFIVLSDHLVPPSASTDIFYDNHRRSKEFPLQFAQICHPLRAILLPILIGQAPICVSRSINPFPREPCMPDHLLPFVREFFLDTTTYSATRDLLERDIFTKMINLRTLSVQAPGPVKRLFNSSSEKDMALYKGSQLDTILAQKTITQTLEETCIQRILQQQTNFRLLVLDYVQIGGSTPARIHKQSTS